jgi:hypothetical protein
VFDDDQRRGVYPSAADGDGEEMTGGDFYYHFRYDGIAEDATTERGSYGYRAN